MWKLDYFKGVLYQVSSESGRQAAVLKLNIGCRVGSYSRLHLEFCVNRLLTFTGCQ